MKKSYEKNKYQKIWKIWKIWITMKQYENIMKKYEQTLTYEKIKR